VRLLRADALLRLLEQSRMDNSREALMTQLATVDVLVIDDLALEPMTRDESRDIYQLFVERNARASTVVTHQPRLQQWGAVFPGAACVVALVDRFNQHCHRLTIDADSWRETHGLDAADTPPSRPPSRRRRRPTRSAATS